MSAHTAFKSECDYDESGEVVNNFYGLLPFVGPQFLSAASAVDFWVGQYTAEAAKDEARFRADSRRSLGSLHSDLRMYRPSQNLTMAANAAAEAVVREVLEHAVGQMHELAVRRRGNYLAQLVTRWFSDGTIDLFRFRVAHLLAAYIEHMPKVGTCYGVIDSGTSDLTLVGWSSAHGGFLDLVHVVAPDEEVIGHDLAAALKVGHDLWPETFEGVRYLTLNDMRLATYHHPTGSVYPFADRDRLGTS